MPYGNFRNPVGLITRMLMSGNRAAYAALVRAGCELAATPFDILASKLKPSTVASDSNVGLPLLLIVGPPRSGTTLLYQYLAYALDVTYPTNLSSLFPRTLINGSNTASAKRIRLRSYFGQTARLNEPNDAFHIWNRWFGIDRYQTNSNLSDEQANAMRLFFENWTTQAGRPFLNKNNRNCHCLDEIAKALPQALFIVVNREPASIVRSLIRARKAVQGSNHIGWGLLCQEQHSSEPLGYVRDVCEQVERINHLLNEQCSTIADERKIGITYESFCDDPLGFAQMLAKKVPEVSLRESAQSAMPTALKSSPPVSLSEDEERIIASYFAA